MNPDFRGVSNAVNVKAALTKEIIIPQYQWNIDRCDGTGKSGYEIEINRMQMIGFQYTWYGADLSIGCSEVHLVTLSSVIDQRTTTETTKRSCVLVTYLFVMRLSTKVRRVD